MPHTALLASGLRPGGGPLLTAGRLPMARPSALARLVVRASEGDGPRSRKGKSYENSKRRKGRPAHLRSPFDTPLRDGNRDRLIGLLTERWGPCVGRRG